MPRFSLSLSEKEIIRFLPTWDFPDYCRALGRGRKQRCACGVTTETQAIRARVGDLYLRASTDLSGAARPGASARRPRQPPGRRRPPGPGTARAAPPSPRRSCRGHQPREVETPPAPSCAPAGSQGVAGGARDAPPLKVSPNCAFWPPKPQQTQLGTSELEATESSLKPIRRGPLPPRTSLAPASAMAPGMSGCRGAALLCLSVLLAHGKCRGAGSG